MTTVEYIHNNKSFLIDESSIPVDSLLDVIHKNEECNKHIVFDSNIALVLDYVKNMWLTSYDHVIKILDYWGVFQSYDAIYQGEKYMRDNMYKLNFNNHDMNIDIYYNLMRVENFADIY